MDIVTSSVADSTSEQVEQLHVCARTLEISEYEVFERAYFAWHGHGAALPELELQFHQYLCRAEIPLWVRHFCRQYLDAHPEALSRQQTDTAQARRARWLALGLIMLSVGLALLL